MSLFGKFLIHTLTVTRHTATATLDDYGQPLTSDDTWTVKGLPQPQPPSREFGGEVERTHEAGAVLSGWTIYMSDLDLEAADTITHDPADCSVAAARDLPLLRWNINNVRNAAGFGHHLEVDADVVTGWTLATS